MLLQLSAFIGNNATFFMGLPRTAATYFDCQLSLAVSLAPLADGINYTSHA